MITYRKATPSDYAQIATLHALSWQQNYRGSLDDHYLDHQAEADRQQVWHGRMHQPKAGQFVDVACDGDRIVGFVCTFVDYDERGAYLDNLHVSADYQGHGIGAQLMSISAQQVLAHRPDSAMYLWVLEKNEGAKRFYERIGGITQGLHYLDLPSGGGSANAYLILWKDTKKLIL